MKLNQNEKSRLLAAWYDAWGVELYRLAFYRLASRLDAEDAVQEAFLRVAAMELDQVKQPRAYLFRALLNGCNDRFRGRRTFAPLDPRAGHAPEVEELEAHEESRRINALLEQLPQEQSEVIRLRLHADLHFTEIGEVLGLPASTLKSRFAAGIERLRKMLNN